MRSVPEAAERYSRQVLFSGIGAAGQRALASARVAIVGLGALGSTTATQLARAGVGRLILIDRDYVEWSNLQRQSLYEEQDARDGLPKALAAAAHLQRLNSEVAVEPCVEDLTAENAERLLHGCQLVMDGLDNFETRYLVNDVCVKQGTPWVYAAVVASYGVVMPIVPGDTPCLRCVYVAQPAAGSTATCDTVGVIGPAVGVVAGFAVAEALKLLVGASARLLRGLTWVDVWNNSFQRTGMTEPAATCLACRAGVYEYLALERSAGAAVLCGRDAVQVRPQQPLQIGLDSLAERLQVLGNVHTTPFLLRFRVDRYELTIFPDGRTIVKGTDSPAIARSLFARYVGE